MGGMMTLTEAYCRVNRGRGLELLSPEDMLKACELMSSLSLPTVLKVFDSGVKVLHINSHNDSNIIKATAEAVCFSPKIKYTILNHLLLPAWREWLVYV
jgi:ESCRT-II complex subunit VPS36